MKHPLTKDQADVHRRKHVGILRDATDALDSKNEHYKIEALQRVLQKTFWLLGALAENGSEEASQALSNHYNWLNLWKQRND